MFGNGEVTGAHDGRFNVLMLGGDAGAGRSGLRPDSMTVASIDAETGRTVLVSLPRNMSNFPFRPGSVMAKQFPDGWSCDTCYLNAVSTWAMDRPELFKHPKQAGVDATIQAIEGITDLRINYWAMVNLQGFRDLVDAVGGVQLNVRSRIPVGGLGSDVTGYIEPGVKTLERARHALVRPCPRGLRRLLADGAPEVRDERHAAPDLPQTALSNFQDIAAASSEMVSTNLPAKELDRFMESRAEGEGPEDLDGLAGPPGDRHRRPRHRARAPDDRGRHHPCRGRYAGFRHRPGRTRPRPVR